MNVLELAKEFGISSKTVLGKLKSLRLKAKDEKQELSSAVAAVVRRELIKDPQSIEKGKLEQEAIEKAKKEKKEAKKGKEKVTKAKAAKSDVKPSADKEAKPKKAKPVKAKAEKPVVVKKKSEKKPEKAKAVSKEPTVAKKEAPKKVKPKASAAPFVPLKPLAKKKRKPAPGRRDEHKRQDTEKKDGDDMGAAGQADSISEIDVADLKSLELRVPISVKDFAVSIQERTGVVLKKLMGMRIFANINQGLDEEIVRRLAIEFGYNLTEVKTQEQQIIDGHKIEDDDPASLKPRAPVITFMGHVDHGKTSLLDKIRKSKVVDKEHGGITQHIGAYSVSLPKGKITFLDTPGHEAFTAMRARGAHITDVVVLVVAADEGIMPQTEEAIDHARAAGVPIIVALNKIDRKHADIDKVKKQLAAKDLNPEDWGGKTIVAAVSAITGEGIDQLLEMILLEAEMLELKANEKKKASGIVVEAHLSRGKGAVASLIVQSGTLNVNDVIIVGAHYGKIKALFDYCEKPITSAGPSTPVEILGLPGVPDAGEMFYVVDDEKQGREISFRRQQQLRDQKHGAFKKITLEDLFSQVQEGKIKELNVILKADVQGSLEALKDSLEKIPSEEVKVRFIHTGVGYVNASDVILATASNAIIIAFQVGVGPRAKQELEENPIDVREYRIIYDAVNEMRKALEGLLEPKIKRKFLSRIEIRQVFKLSKSGIVAGCYVTKGKVTRKAKMDIVRNGEVIYTGKISSLKRFKDDVKEVSEGYECGITIEGFTKVEAGDIIEVYELETIARTL